MEAEERPAKRSRLNTGLPEDVRNVLEDKNPERELHPIKYASSTVLNGDDGQSSPAGGGSASNETVTVEAEDAPKLSKNQQKKIRRQQEWEAGRAERKARNKQKDKERKERKRAARREEADSTSPGAQAANGPTASFHSQGEERRGRHQRGHQLPITFILDCGWDELMLDKERTSLASQLTRCYSDNTKSPFKAHLAVSSFGGKLKERFDTALSRQYEGWRGVRFSDKDFLRVAKEAQDFMKICKGQELVGAFSPTEENGSDSFHDGEVVYLSSDSDTTLTELKPYSTYIIGGIVDRNRHKGVCHKRAIERGVKTAKLPIGDFLQMASRYVLATNHVAEIMLRWLELKDWGVAFTRVIPKRKEFALKDRQEEEEQASPTNSERISIAPVRD